MGPTKTSVGGGGPDHYKERQNSYSERDECEAGCRGGEVHVLVTTLSCVGMGSRMGQPAEALLTRRGTRPTGGGGVPGTLGAGRLLPAEVVRPVCQLGSGQQN